MMTSHLNVKFRRSLAKAEDGPLTIHLYPYVDVVFRWVRYAVNRRVSLV